MGKGAPRKKPDPLFPVRQVVILTAAALAFRILYWILASKSLFMQTPVVDGSFFDIWARTLAEGRVFQEAVFFKPPLYAYLLSWLYKAGFSLTGVQMLQMLVGILTVLLTLAIGRLVFSPRIAFGGALATALLPILPFFETQLLAETWTTALTLGALLLILRVVKGRTLAVGRVLFAAGLLLGVAALGRPNLLLVIVTAAAWSWWQGRSSAGKPLAPGSLGLLLAGFMVAISPATLHNLRYGEFTLISANLGANLVAGNSDAADGVSAIPVGARWDDLQLQSRQAGAKGPADASRWLTKDALRWMGDNPVRTLALAGKKALLLVNGWEGRNNINPRWLAEQDGVFPLARWWPATWLILPPALLGLGLFRRWRPAGGLLFWVVVLQAAAVLPFFVNARFRMPLVPLLALFAAAGVAVLCRQWSDRRRGALGLGLAVLAVLFVLVNVDWCGLGGEKWLARDWFNQGLIQARSYGDRRPDFEAAERCFRRAVELDPDEVDFQERLGAHYQMLVMQVMGSARSAMEDQAWPRATAYLDEAEKLLAASRAAHRRATEIMPRSYNSWINLGNAENMSGDARAAHATMALAREDSSSARESALAALRFYQYAVQYYQRSLEVNPQLEASKRSVNGVFRSVMELPGLDPTIVQFQQRAAAARNRNQRR